MGSHLGFCPLLIPQMGSQMASQRGSQMGFRPLLIPLKGLAAARETGRRLLVCLMIGRSCSCCGRYGAPSWRRGLSRVVEI